MDDYCAFCFLGGGERCWDRSSEAEALFGAETGGEASEEVC